MGPPAEPEQRVPARRPRARIRPEALAAARGSSREGLDWLGRAPDARASLLYRIVRFVARALLFGVFRFRIETSGREHLPKGGYLIVAAAHRGWIDPFVVMHALPSAPRCWFLGSGPSTFTSRWREALIRRLGGLLPVWRGGLGIDAHVRSARAVLDAGAVFIQMPEGSVNGPPGRIGAFRPGAALIALRTGARIVPVAMAGTEELYVGRRLASRILPAVTMVELLGDAWIEPLPPPDSRAELALARLASDALAARLGPVVEELYAFTVDPPGHRRWLRRRLTWLLLGPGPLERRDSSDD
ncbi:MAG TPA: lysophospholipid acyltransferase family protein [Candidatus Eisenbacteria bacterium]|nr:lysophospholipid acyltransferase family protein [Candidatus Eisenbacteria bacterium]